MVTLHFINALKPPIEVDETDAEAIKLIKFMDELLGEFDKTRKKKADKEHEKENGEPLAALAYCLESPVECFKAKKLYDIVNGKATDEDGEETPAFNSFDEFQRFFAKFGIKFLEIDM